MTLKAEKRETLSGFAVTPWGRGWKRFDSHVQGSDHRRTSHAWQPLPVAPAKRRWRRTEGTSKRFFFPGTRVTHPSDAAAFALIWCWFQTRRGRRLSLWSLQVNDRLGQTSGFFFPGDVFRKCLYQPRASSPLGNSPCPSSVGFNLGHR